MLWPCCKQPGHQTNHANHTEGISGNMRRYFCPSAKKYHTKSFMPDKHLVARWPWANIDMIQRPERHRYQVLSLFMPNALTCTGTIQNVRSPKCRPVVIQLGLWDKTTISFMHLAQGSIQRNILQSAFKIKGKFRLIGTLWHWVSNVYLQGLNPWPWRCKHNALLL